MKYFCNNRILLPIAFLLIALMAIQCKKEKTIEDPGTPEDKVELNAFPANLSIGKNAMAKVLLSSSATKAIEWSVSEKPYWVTITPDNGILDANTTLEILLEIGDTNLDEGDYYDNIFFSSPDADDEKMLLNTVIDDNPFYPSYSPQWLNYTTNIDSLSIDVIPGADFMVYWKSKNVPSHLKVNEGKGYFNQLNRLDVIVDRSKLEQTGVYIDTIMIETSLGTQDQFKVTVEHFVENVFWVLPFDIIDAAFDYNTQKIIAVSENPNRLHIIDPQTESIESLNLQLEPYCLAINESASYAVVGHDAFFSYVNLQTLEVENTFAISVKAYDILLSENGYVYTFPDDNVYALDGFSSFELATETETISIGGQGNRRFKVCLHPANNSVYGIDGAHTPRDVFKFDISINPPAFLYDSPYHGDYYFGSNVWVTKNGAKIFTNYTILNSTEDPETDLLYAGSIMNNTYMATFDDAPDVNRFVGIMAEENWTYENYNSMVLFSLDYHNPLQTYDLPLYILDSKATYNPVGRFVFLKQNGLKAWVLQQAEESYPYEDDWAVVIINIENP